MKLLRNSYREILVLFYFSIALFLPAITVISIVHTLPNLNLLVQKALLFFAVLIGTFLTLISVVVFYTFLSTLLQTKSQGVENSVESFYR